MLISMFRLRTLVVFGAGFAAAYFFDPENGPRRRAAALRRIQGDVVPQARSVVQSAAERAPKLTSLPDGGAAVRRATTRHRPAAKTEAEPTETDAGPVSES